MLNVLASIDTTILSYLWGIETGSKVIKDTSENTILSYLWGIETHLF